MPPTSLDMPQAMPLEPVVTGDIEDEGDGDENTGGNRQIESLKRMFRCFIDTRLFGHFGHCSRK
ncbi:hypothetical protein ACLK13_04790 [Escherichia coli]